MYILYLLQLQHCTVWIWFKENNILLNRFSHTCKINYLWLWELLCLCLKPNINVFSPFLACLEGGVAAKMSSPSLSSSISISSSADSTADFAGFLILLAGCFAGDAFAREFFLKQNGLFYSIAQHGSKGMTLADK